MLTRVAVLAVVVTAVGAASAQAKIVLKESIAGVPLGATRAQVQAILGAPDKDIAPKAGDSEHARFWDYGRGLRIGFRDDGDAVTVLVTRSRRERTASGVGPGSSRALVKRRLRGEHCSPDICLIGTDALGTRSTIFSFDRRGRVRDVVVIQRPDTYRP
jgi:hypothetical protein